MNMTLNEALFRQTLISKILLSDGTKELSKELKSKLMSMRIDLGKFRKAFDEDNQEALKELVPEELRELSQKENKTEDETARLKELETKLNEEYNSFLLERGAKEVVFNKQFTNEEYDQILDVNSNNAIDINGNKIQAADFLEMIYSLFVVE